MYLLFIIIMYACYCVSMYTNDNNNINIYIYIYIYIYIHMHTYIYTGPLCPPKLLRLKKIGTKKFKIEHNIFRITPSLS